MKDEILFIVSLRRWRASRTASITSLRAGNIKFRWVNISNIAALFLLLKWCLVGRLKLCVFLLVLSFFALT